MLEQHHVRPQALDEREPVLDAGGAADRDEARLGAQQHGETRADRRLWVDDGYAGHAPHPSNEG